MTTHLTEDQIERKVERMIDAIDRAFLAGFLSQTEYDLAMADVDVWAKQQYALLKTYQYALLKT